MVHECRKCSSQAGSRGPLSGVNLKHAHWVPCIAPASHSQGKLKHYVFVASAGAYKADPIEPCHFEGDARKSSAGHVEVENYLKVRICAMSMCEIHM
jgi:hypothetical protein